MITIGQCTPGSELYLGYQKVSSYERSGRFGHNVTSDFKSMTAAVLTDTTVGRPTVSVALTTYRSAFTLFLAMAELAFSAKPSLVAASPALHRRRAATNGHPIMCCKAALQPPDKHR